MCEIKACLFDLDGVIVDTAKYHYLAWKKLASELGFDFNEEHNERLKGVSRMDSLEILLEVGGLKNKFTESEKISFAEKKNNWYVEYISKMTPNEILPGVKNFLTRLKLAGIKTGIGSVSKNTMTILNNVGLTSYFDTIIDGTKITYAKPNPEVFLKGASELNILPKNCVVFEDAKAGIEAAINAEMYSIGVGSPQILNKANFVISSFNEMNLDRLKF